jgi:hypothetical protein
MDGALISIRVVLRSQSLVAAAKFDPYRSKVAEEMLLCEVMVQQQHMPKAIKPRNLLMSAAGPR